MKFYGLIEKRRHPVLLTEEEVPVVMTDEENKSMLYQDFLKLASYYETTNKFYNIKDGLKKLSTRGQDDALAYYLFNADEIDADMVRHAFFVEKYGDKDKPEVLKVLAGLHYHDNFVNFQGESVISIKSAIEFVKSVDQMRKSAFTFPSETQLEQYAQLRVLLNNSEFIKYLNNAMDSYLNIYKNKNEPDSKRLMAFCEWMNLSSYDFENNTLSTEMSENQIKLGMMKLNRALKESKLNGRYYLPYAYHYYSLVHKNETNLKLYSKSVLKSIAKLPFNESIKFNDSKFIK